MDFSFLAPFTFLPLLSHRKLFISLQTFPLHKTPRDLFLQSNFNPYLAISASQSFMAFVLSESLLYISRESAILSIRSRSWATPTLPQALQGERGSDTVVDLAKEKLASPSVGKRALRGEPADRMDRSWPSFLSSTGSIAGLEMITGSREAGCEMFLGHVARVY